jgi:hypothetical protein
MNILARHYQMAVMVRIVLLMSETVFADLDMKVDLR